ncbi:hypothetical protein L3i22_077430 [Actinoplanes sp. L3-i22]|nr:hypothetical protein L3i22_077430 [Actinoplanes sp. L3-i22]
MAGFSAAGPGQSVAGAREISLATARQTAPVPLHRCTAAPRRRGAEKALGDLNALK